MLPEPRTLPSAPHFVGKILLGILALTILAAAYFSGAIGQDPGYHRFADQRQLMNIPYALDVLSNLPFCLFGIIGIYATVIRRQGLQAYTAVYLTFFISIFLTGLGSGYYHLEPNNATLVWDRLPMAVAFMSILAVVFAERVDQKLGITLFPWLVASGILSVCYWHWSDDLRAYILVQFGTLLALTIIILRYRGANSGLLWLAMAFYLLAKLLEFYDLQIFQLTAEWISGHSLKHLAAAMTALIILFKMQADADGRLSGNTRALQLPRPELES